MNARAVDGLRATAALSVLGYHAWLYSMDTPTAGAHRTTVDLAAHELRLGLVLFFVLSGFLLFTPWLRTALDGAPAPRLGGYLARRGARILPAYYVALVGSVVLLWHHGAVPGVRLPSGQDLWLFAVLGQNFSEGTLLRLDPPMWTLTVEATFYLLLPALGWLALRLRRAGRPAQAIVPLALLGGGVAYNAAIAGRHLPDTTSKILPAMIGYFAIGMLAAVLAWGRAPGRRSAAVLLAAGAGLVIANAVWHAHGATMGSHDLPLRIWRDLPAAVGFGAIVVVAARSATPLRSLSALPLAWTGRRSYGLYLWHVPLMLWLRAQGMLPGSMAGAVLVTLPLALGVAALSWTLVERPAQERARRATARPRLSAARERPATA